MTPANTTQHYLSLLSTSALTISSFLWQRKIEFFVYNILKIIGWSEISISVLLIHLSLQPPFSLSTMRIISGSSNIAEDADLLLREIINVTFSKYLYNIERGAPPIDKTKHNEIDPLDWYPSFTFDGVKYGSRATVGYLFINEKDIRFAHSLINRFVSQYLSVKNPLVESFMKQNINIHNDYCTTLIAAPKRAKKSSFNILFESSNAIIKSILPALSFEASKGPISFVWHVEIISDKFTFEIQPSSAKTQFEQNVNSIFYDSNNVILEPSEILLTEQLTTEIFKIDKQILNQTIKTDKRFPINFYELMKSTTIVDFKPLTNVWEANYESLVEIFGDIIKKEKCGLCRKSLFGENYVFYNKDKTNKATVKLFCPYCAHTNTIDTAGSELIIKYTTPTTIVEAIEKLKISRQKKSILIDMEINGVKNGPLNELCDYEFIDVGTRYRGVFNMRNYMFSKYASEVDRKLFIIEEEF